MIKFSDSWRSPDMHIHKYGPNEDLICLHENMEYLEEYAGSPYFIKHCPNCGFFMTKRFEEAKK